MNMMWGYKAGTTNLAWVPEKTFGRGRILDKLEFDSAACDRKHKIGLNQIEINFSHIKALRKLTHAGIVL